MNKEVSFEIAKLLKEKGFDRVYNNSVFYKKGYRNSFPLNLFITKEDYLSNKEQYLNYYVAPTIAEVIMWLYEKHDIWISVIPYEDEELSQTLWENKIIDIKDDYNDCSDYTFYHSPTEAYEAAILYCLNNLI